MINDDYKRLRTGHYIREYASTITANGHYGSQSQDLICNQENLVDEESNYWICKNPLHVNIPGRSQQKSQEVLCFANNEEDLFYVDDPEHIKNTILEEVCENAQNCNESNADLSKMSALSLTFPTNLYRFNFENSQIVDSLKDDNKTLKISIGD